MIRWSLLALTLFGLSSCGDGAGSGDPSPEPADTTGSPHSVAGSIASTRDAEPTAVEIGLVDSIPWEGNLSSGAVHRVVVRRAGRVDTIPGVTTDRMPVVVGDMVVYGFDTEGHDTVDRGFAYDVSTGTVETVDLPPDFHGFLAHDLAPDGRHLGYVAKSDAGDLAIVVRRWPGGGEVYRSPPFQGYPSDADNARVRWIGPDRVDIRVRLDDLSARGQRWFRIHGSPGGGGLVADTVSGAGDAP